MASNVGVADRSPSPTSVAGLSTTIPTLVRPIMIRKKPIPAAMESFSSIGIELMIHSRTGRRLRITNSVPDMNTAISAVCQATPIPMTTPYVKNAFNPMPGAIAIG